MSTTLPLWTPAPERVAGSQLDAFRRLVAERHDVDLPDSRALHRWSTEHLDDCWRAVWDSLGVVGTPGDVAFDPGDGTMLGGHFFPGAQLNLTENLLVGPSDDSDPAIVFVREDGQRRLLTWAQLRVAVATTAAALRAAGVGVGDRVAAWMPNVPETVVAFLATNALGAVFSSTSADFGAAGVVDRFGQIGPKVLFAADGYLYGGKRFDCLGRLPEIQAVPRLPRRRGGRGVPAAGLRTAPVRPPGRHPVLLGHDRRPEVHRAPRRWPAREAPQRAPAPLRCPSG